MTEIRVDFDPATLVPDDAVIWQIIFDRLKAAGIPIVALAGSAVGEVSVTQGELISYRDPNDVIVFIWQGGTIQ